LCCRRGRRARHDRFDDLLEDVGLPGDFCQQIGLGAHALQPGIAGPVVVVELVDLEVFPRLNQQSIGSFDFSAWSSAVAQHMAEIAAC